MNSAPNREDVPSLDSSTPVPDHCDAVGDLGATADELSTSNNDAASYRLAEPESSPTPSDIPIAPQQGADSTFQASTDEAPASAPETFPDPAPEVREVWSRWVDWKEPLLWTSAGVGLATLILFGGPYVAMIAFLTAATYGAYRVITTLEVPVRVTPEQAVQEYFSAAGHRLPNFQRMYGLLTADGKRCDSFRTSSEFRAYWRERIADFAHSPIWLVPLEFHIEGFKCRYSGDKSMAWVRYIVEVTPRGRLESAKPIAEFDARNLVVKGPDGQWYLNDGTLD